LDEIALMDVKHGYNPHLVLAEIKYMLLTATGKIKPNEGDKDGIAKDGNEANASGKRKTTALHEKH